MDKLELDARVARLERRVGYFVTLATLFAIGLAAFVGLAMTRRAVNAELSTPAMVMEVPAPPPALPPSPSAVFAPMPMPPAAGSMPALFQQLATIRELVEEQVITEAEWAAKKELLLAEPVTVGDLKSDLQGVQHLWNTQAISEAERDSLKARLLGIEEDCRGRDDPRRE
jgi:hypothetical protein